MYRELGESSVYNISHTQEDRTKLENEFIFHCQETSDMDFAYFANRLLWYGCSSQDFHAYAVPLSCCMCK